MINKNLLSYAVFTFLIVTLSECLSFYFLMGTGVAFVNEQVTPGIEIVYQEPGESPPKDSNVVLTTGSEDSQINNSGQPETVVVDNKASSPESVTGVIPFGP